MTLDPALITGYHAHIYYDAATRETAARLRQAIGEQFAGVVGRWHDEAVGPHPVSMYQFAFAVEEFPLLVPWLMLNRDGLHILVHPETGDGYRDHATNSPLARRAGPAAARKSGAAGARAAGTFGRAYPFLRQNVVLDRVRRPPMKPVWLLALCLCLGGCGVVAAPCRVGSGALKAVPVVGHVAAAPSTPAPT